MRTTRALGVLTALALIGCETQATAPVADTTPMFVASANDRFPFAFDFFACDEVVDVSGTFHPVFAFTQSASGTTHFVNHINAHGVGTGRTSGATYQWNDVIQFNDNWQPFTNGPPNNITDRQRLELIGQGQTPNLILQATFHFTVNANGELTSLVSDFSVECH